MTAVPPVALQLAASAAGSLRCLLSGPRPRKTSARASNGRRQDDTCFMDAVDAGGVLSCSSSHHRRSKTIDGLPAVALRSLGCAAASASRIDATWLILPVVICLSQRLSHACVSMNKFRL